MMLVKRLEFPYGAAEDRYELIDLIIDFLFEM